jgi:hypothetical protein
LHHFANDDGGGRLHVAPRDEPGQRGQGADDRFLIGARGPADGHGRRIGVAAAGHQLARDIGKGGEPHEDHQRFGVAHLVPIDGGHGMAGHEGDHLGMVAVRQGNAGIGRDAQRRGDTRHDFERDAGIGQRFGLLAAAAENKWVAAFEPHHREAAPRPLNQHGADFLLGEGVDGFFLADVDTLGVRWRQVQQRGRRQVVEEHGVGPFQNPSAFASDEFRVTRPRADEVDLSHRSATVGQDGILRRIANPPAGVL